MFLRESFNVYTSHLILGQTTLDSFMSMTHQMRMQHFLSIAPERNLVLPLFAINLLASICGTVGCPSIIFPHLILYFDFLHIFVVEL